MTIKRLKAWAHWARLEVPRDSDRLLMADDIDKVLAVVEAASALHREATRIGINPNATPYRTTLAEALQRLEPEE